DLSESQASVRNASMPDDPRVYYQSFAGVSYPFGIATPWELAARDQICGSPVAMDPLNPLFLSVAAEMSNPSDGLVSVESSRWGVFRGCLSADHLDEVSR